MKNETESYKEALLFVYKEAAQYANKEFNNAADQISFREAQIEKIRVFANDVLSRFIPRAGEGSDGQAGIRQVAGGTKPPSAV